MRNNISTIWMGSGDSKCINDSHVWFDSIASLGKGYNPTLLWFCNRKCMGKILIGYIFKYVIFKQKCILNIFSELRSTINEPNFKIICNCINELLNVFEDSAQRIHTIRPEWNQMISDRKWYIENMSSIGDHNRVVYLSSLHF